MKFKSTVLLAFLCSSYAHASDIENACFNCPPLDKVADAVTFNDSNYYANAIAAVNNNLSATELKAAITAAISQNQKQLTYSEVWTALTQTDEDPANPDNVILLYRGNSIAKFSNGSGSQSSNPDNWNREHVWAKSHGFPSSSLEAYTDINHLRPADISVNSSRGNLDFDNSDTPLTEAPLNKVDDDSFEPRDAVKGDVARMVFYMDTRYEGMDATPDLQVVDRLTSTGEAALGRLCRLIAWNNADPVDATEQNRNNKVYEFQGNRNPYIDHPEWVNKIYSADACATTPGGDTPPASNGSVFINEIHYDNVSSDVGEAIEVAGSASTDLSGLSLVLYNGSNGTSYKTVNLSGVIADQQAGFGTLSFDISGIQNGAPDGVALIDSDNNVLQFLSYEGSLTATNGPASGMTSSDIGVSETSSTVVGASLQLTGTGNKAADFTWQVTDNNTFAAINSGQTFSSGGGEEPPVSSIGQCSDNATLISAVQGETDTSPMTNQQVILEGVVTGVFDNLHGFFIQEEQANQDNNSNTSEGIFVYNNKNTQTPTQGDVIRVIGDISERYGRTQLSASEDIINCGTASATTTALPLPYASTNDLEALEGMLVTNAQPLTVTNTYELGHYGEVGLSNGRLFNPTNVFAPNSAEAINLAEQNALNSILLDDGIGGSNPSNVIYPTGGLSASNTLRTGDLVSELTGIVDFSYNKYRIVPTIAPTFIQDNPRTSAPDVAEGNVKIASLNVLNLFNGDGNGNGFPTSRGADSVAEYQRQIAKTVAAIVAINADVIGLMEIENDGVDSQSTLADLVAQLNTQLAENEQYNFINTGGAIGTDEIAVALLFKPNKVTPSTAVKINNNAIFNRPPLAQTFQLNENNETFTVVVNHFKSKGGCRSATGADQDQGDGQACFNARRVNQANELLSWLSSDDELKQEENVLIIGDLNSYAKEDPITAITNQGYVNLINHYVGEQGYSFAYGGELGYLDHALASPALLAKTVDATEWHINADEPRVLDYNLENKTDAQQNDFYAADPYRMSDHDPLIVTLNLAPDVDPNVSVINIDVVNDLTAKNIQKFQRMQHKWLQKVASYQRKITHLEDKIEQLDPQTQSEKIARLHSKIADYQAQISIYNDLSTVVDITTAELELSTIEVSKQTINDANVIARMQRMITTYQQRSDRSNERATTLEQQAEELIAKGRQQQADKKLAKALALRANVKVYQYLIAVINAAI